MLSPPTAVTFTCFLVKVASRCNLACDYCYMYEHADQSWREQPRFISDATVDALAGRIEEYVGSRNVDRMLVVLHGGEPLLAGSERLSRIARTIRRAVPADVAVDVSIQTNGVLLDQGVLEALAAEDISVSLSIDGPSHAQDLHRLTIRGRSSFQRAEQALQLLQQNQSSFAGVIAVIDPSVPPADLLSFFANYEIPQLDFLLPDAHHDNPPPGRAEQSELYVRWLVDAFDLWFDAYPHIPIRSFDSLLGAIVGHPSGTDAFGFGDVTLLTIETDGSYHDLDVLKITEPGRTALGMNVTNNSISEAAGSEVIASHRSLLNEAGLSHQCRRCPEMAICGGGSVPHRFGQGTFEHPTVYCGEMLALIPHARARMSEAIEQSAPLRSNAGVPVDMDAFELVETSKSVVGQLIAAWEQAAVEDLMGSIEAAGSQGYGFNAVAESSLRRLSIHPVVVLWSHLRRSSTPVRAFDGRALAFEPAYVQELSKLVSSATAPPNLHRDDPLLRLPFGPPIFFDSPDQARKESSLVVAAFELIGSWRPELLAEMYLLCPEVQFIRDTSADEDKCVSFSDDIVPGALFVTAHTSKGLLDPYNLADSLLHEYRHQKLYLLDRAVPLVENDSVRVRSPWRSDLRPPSGLLHACFVFVELTRFWLHVQTTGPAAMQSTAINQIDCNRQNLVEGLNILDRAPLTPAGRHLTTILQTRLSQ